MKKTDTLFKQLHEANEKIKELELDKLELLNIYKTHTIGCEIWKGSKLIIIENLKNENETLKEKISEIDAIVDKDFFDIGSNEFKIFKIINKVR